MTLGVRRNLGKDCLYAHLRRPIPLRSSTSRIQHDPWEVESTWRRIRGHGMRAKTFRAPSRELRQRPATFDSAAHVLNSQALAIPVVHLLPDESSNIPRMQAVAHLMPRAAEPNIT